MPNGGFQIDKGNYLENFRSSKEVEPGSRSSGGTEKDKTGVEGRKS